ncbi:ATP-binding protein [Rhizobium halophytocola]|uniref:DNA helicase HerA-like ATPase n=1 Tax=Rhizobium halophytocola TaxID=735519 RepID=A0ABS4E6C2_9HYPH|nr:ATP-binding protein [Rhizobium halophytocola]MBP1853497.1 DNA helicase HerA-like ATPase [Rhizobium halophytocola]
MRNQDLHSSVQAGELDRRDEYHPGNRFLGRIVACSGARATIAAYAEDGGTDLTELWSVGRLISISVGENRVVALVYSMQTADKNWAENVDNCFLVEVELLGEVHKGPHGGEEFSTGISAYPYLGAIAHRIRAADLLRIYDSGTLDTQIIGKLTQDESIDATIHIPSMLSKHFAVVGSTGVGKSTAVSLLIRKAIESDPKLRVLILDPHNEFAAAFPEHAVCIDTDTLDLPFWLMKLEEFAEVLFRGRPAVPEELDILRDLLPEAKRAFRGSESAYMRRSSEQRSSITADTPVPYRIADLLALIDERIGKLEGREEKPYLRSLKMRVTSAINDQRYHFMFSNNTINDTILETISHIFRIPGDGKPIATFQLAGIPSEVVNSVASVLCRMAFEIALWSNGAVRILVVCEEAHRYVPADQSLGFFPTRQAIARIAKEGRKYGVSLGIITQRPGELDQTILSQCSTVFAMRLANDRDQEIIRSAIPDSSISTTSFISSIGNGEAIAFGEAIAVPMRMRFARVDDRTLPKANGVNPDSGIADPSDGVVDLGKVVNRMRSLSGPDISAFQQSFQGASSMADDADLREFADAPPLAANNSEPALESYRPDMLPGTGASASPRPAARPAAPAPSSYAPAREREPAGFGQPLSRDIQPARFERDAMADTPKRETPRPSLRESILKRPLSSLYDKD